MSAIRPEEFIIKNGTPVLIRSLELPDWQTQMEFRNLFKMESIFTWHSPHTTPQEDETKKHILTALTDPKECFIGAFVGTPETCTLIGQIGIHRFLGRDHPWTEHAARFGMAVLRDFWGQGLGMRLLSAMENEARRMGYKVLHAEVREANIRAIAMYKKFGFEITGMQKKAARIDGFYHNDLLLFKELL